MLTSSSAWGAGPSIAEQVSQSRARVEDLAHQLRDRRREARDELSALRLERAELQRQVRLEEIRGQTLAAMAQARKEQATGLEGQADTWRQPLMNMVAAARRHVQQGLPYQVSARLEVLDKIAQELDRSQPDFAQVLGRLWRFVEEEEAMGRHMELSRQAIEVEGERLLAEVAHIALALLYVRAPDGRLGWAEPGDGGWSFKWLKQNQAQAVVARVFESFDEHQVVGPKRLLIPKELP